MAPKAINIKGDRDYYLGKKISCFWVVPRDVASERLKNVVTQDLELIKLERAVFLDFSSAIMRYGEGANFIERIR